MAGQIALVVQNTNLVSEVSYKTMMQERARLARETHDGLAQTLGFLKLQGAQLKSFLARGEYDRALQNAETMHNTLSEAYQDARQAIDGLRLSPSDCGLPGWLEQTAQEFSDLTGTQVAIVDNTLEVNLPIEYHAQLIRIVQEALSNVRKHSKAEQVSLACFQDGSDLILEVQDNGKGFMPNDGLAFSQHGLKGMRERADLIGADFQVISRPGEGTTVRVRLPVKNIDEVMS
jgi:two-component system nitrate/nitrite sensor histidine kinase NarX